jgi:hypothetical protein
VAEPLTPTAASQGKETASPSPGSLKNNGFLLFIGNKWLYGRTREESTIFFYPLSEAVMAFHMFLH